MKARSYYDSKIGTLEIIVQDDALIGIHLCNKADQPQETDQIETQIEYQMIPKTKQWLDRYFQNENPPCNLKIKLYGSEYQNTVWQTLLDIPYGQTVSYQDIAIRVEQKLHRKNISPRAIGQTIKRNPIAIYIPCHRVVGKNQKLVGYYYGVEIKKYLLALEDIPVFSE